MIELNDVYKKEESNWVSRVIFDEVVIMPLCRSEEDMQYIYSISNETGSRLWQLLDGGHSVRDIQEILKSEYQGQGEVVEREVRQFLEDFLEVKLIQKLTLKQREEVHIEHRASSIEHPVEKKPWITPEIAKVKMQPEQAVLTCCLAYTYAKSGDSIWNLCSGVSGSCSSIYSCDNFPAQKADYVYGPAS